MSYFAGHIKTVAALVVGVFVIVKGVIPLVVESIYFTPSTVYSADYNEEHFASLTVGMSGGEVVKAAGAPLRTFTDQWITVSAYSDLGYYSSNRTCSYLQRWVAFGPDGNVCYIWKRLVNGNGDVDYPVFEWSDQKRPAFYESTLGPTACKQAVEEVALKSTTAS